MWDLPGRGEPWGLAGLGSLLDLPEWGTERGGPSEPSDYFPAQSPLRGGVLEATDVFKDSGEGATQIPRQVKAQQGPHTHTQPADQKALERCPTVRFFKQDQEFTFLCEAFRHLNVRTPLGAKPNALADPIGSVACPLAASALAWLWPSRIDLLLWAVHKRLLQLRHVPKGMTNLRLCNSHSSPTQWGRLSSPFYRWGN